MLAEQPASAQTFPSKAIRLIVPFAAGGNTDIIARFYAPKMSELLGQQIIIDNRGGAGGTIGTRAVSKSAPDGYTILLGYTGTLAIGPSLYANAGYDPRTDFAPIGMIGMAPSVLVVHPSVPAHSVGELIKLAKDAPGKIQYGSPSTGTVNHLAAELLASMANIKLGHIPYKGTGPAISDLLGGHIAMMFAPIPAAHGNVSTGMLRPLGVSSLKRSALLPDIPTIAEAGLPGFEATQRSVLLAPEGTPPAIVERLNRELNALLTTDEVKMRLALEGAEPIPGPPEAYTADVEREEKRWSKLVQSIGLKGE